LCVVFLCIVLILLKVVLIAGINLKQVQAGEVEYHAIHYLIDRLRADVRFRCPIVVIVEAVACLTASNVARYLRTARLPDVYVMHERSPVNGQWREGVPKDDAITQQLAYSLTRVMSVGYLALGEEIITYKDGKESVQKELDKLRNMMNNFRRVWKEKTKPEQIQTYKITAKTLSSGDDTLIALCEAVFWREQFWLDPHKKYVAQKISIESRKPDFRFPL